jgi:muramidase (phage lysozyme)
LSATSGFSIPTYIVMCESGGNYRAVNSSTGAGGAYQIMPSTWHAYGGKGMPQNGSKQEQDAIALKIYKSQGSSPWSCA